MARLQAGDAEEAARGEREALQIFREIGDRVGEAIGLLHLGQISLHVGDAAAARAHLEQCLSIARDIKHQEVEGECELTLGESAFEAEDPAQALHRFKRSLNICREAADKRGEANALWWIGKVDLQAGDLASARHRFDEALQAFRAFEMREELFGCLEDYAVIAGAEGRHDVAASVAAAVTKSRGKLVLTRSVHSARHWQAVVAGLREKMNGAEFDAAWSDGADWTLDDAIQRAQAAHRESALAAG